MLYKWENDTRIWKMSNTVAPFSKYVLRRFIEDQKYDIYETKQLRMIIESRGDGRAVGGHRPFFEIDPTNRRAGIGILVYEDRDRGQGYASCALTSMIKYAFQVLGLNQLYCNVLSNNLRSLNLFKSKGLHYGRSEGGVGAFHDRMAGRIHASTGQSRQGVGGGNVRSGGGRFTRGRRVPFPVRGASVLTARCGERAKGRQWNNYCTWESVGMRLPERPGRPSRMACLTNKIDYEIFFDAFAPVAGVRLFRTGTRRAPLAGRGEDAVRCRPPTRIISKIGFSTWYFDKEAGNAQVNNRISATFGVDDWAFNVRMDLVSINNVPGRRGFVTGAGNMKVNILNSFLQ